MKRTMTTLGTLMMGATPVMASTGQETTGTSMMVILFLGFGAVVVVCQLIPGVILLGSMLKGLFGKAEHKANGKVEYE
jgi:hypothetical protein